MFYLFLSLQILASSNIVVSTGIMAVLNCASIYFRGWPILADSGSPSILCVAAAQQLVDLIYSNRNANGSSGVLPAWWYSVFCELIGLDAH